MSASPLPQYEVTNQILTAIPPEEYSCVGPHLEAVHLGVGDVVYEPDDEIRYVFFPETAVVSVVTTMEDGSSAEVGMVGPEGMVGIRVFLGAYTTPYKASVLIKGEALRMKADVLSEGGSRCPTLQNLLLRYTAALLIQLRQLIACNGLHPLEARLCRWLLMLGDRTGENEFSFTQEMVSRKLGVRREGVTLAANNLQKKGLINNTRARIEVLDRQGLKVDACECYQMIKEEYAHILSV